METIAIIDYGMGNLRSVQKALEQVGAQAIITSEAAVIRNAKKIVLPGVGAMRPAMEKLTALKLIPVVQEAVNSKRPFLGICLGLQLLFDESDEGGTVKGLGVLPGRVLKFSKLKVPHMGWNRIDIQRNDCPLFNEITTSEYVYFCHSYFVKPDDNDIVAAKTNYGLDFVSSVYTGSIFGVQFHPEKSQSVGLKMLKNFVHSV